LLICCSSAPNFPGRGIRDEIFDVIARLNDGRVEVARAIQVFAKLKTLLRKTDPRTIEATWRGIGDLLGHFAPQASA